MDYDDDDLDYSSHEEEEFDENKLNNDEYDLLHDTLPALKEKLKSYNDEIPEYDLKEALYYNYFEIEPTVEELKSKFKRVCIDKCLPWTSQRKEQRKKLAIDITSLLHYVETSTTS